MPKDELDPEDPLEFVGVTLPGGPDSDRRMAAAVVEEYLLFGFDREGLRALFTDPNYAATHRILREHGPEFVEEVIDGVLAEWRPGAPAAPAESPEPTSPDPIP